MTPRAVAPLEMLGHFPYPMYVTPGTYLDSPLPLGIAVCVVEEDRSFRELPLIFVSKQAASSRGVPAGWYLCAEIGKRFKIVV